MPPHKKPSLRRMIARRLGLIAVVCVVVSTAMFILAAVSPFDPLAGALDDQLGHLSPAQVARLREIYNADAPWYQHWWAWVTGLAQGDLGWSRVFDMPVADVFAQRLGWTLLLSFCSVAVMAIAALVLGLLAGYRPGGVIDRLVSGLGVLIAATPSYVYSLGALLLFAVSLKVIPGGGAGPLGTDPQLATVGPYLITPVIVLALSQLSWPLLAVRQATAVALRSPAIVAAHARGLSSATVLTRHVAPMSLLPLVTLIGGRLGDLVVGAVVVETVFSWPGLAQATVESAVQLDFPLLAALTVGTTIVVMLGSLFADVCYLLIDPRVSDV